MSYKDKDGLYAVIDTQKGKIVLELEYKKVPMTVANFVGLAEGELNMEDPGENFYEGLNFHRVIENFMIQGGDPTGTGMGGPGWTIKGEFASNGVKNTLKHTRGVISMARSARPDSAGSQFFIMHKDAPHLDGQYAAFGKMTDGFDTLDDIAKTPTDYSDRPRAEQKIKSVTVEE